MGANMTSETTDKRFFHVQDLALDYDYDQFLQWAYGDIEDPAVIKRIGEFLV